MTIKDCVELGLSEENARKLAFMTAKTLDEALTIVWGSGDAHAIVDSDYYYHYTSLPSLMSNILDGKWHLTRSTSQRLNDRQEVKKFGDAKIARQTYQLSFGKGVRESAAFWGLYGRNSPFAIKVLIPARAIENWVEFFRARAYDADFKDVVYASIPLRKRRSYDKARGCNLVWGGVTCNFGNDKNVKNGLAKELQDPKYTGWLKDLEWSHESETRLCVKRPNVKEQSIDVPFPPELVEKMSFTFSPWANDECMGQVRQCIERCLRKNQARLKSEVKKRRGFSKRFHRSTLFGALNFGREVPARCAGKRCRFGVLTGKDDQSPANCIVKTK